MGRLDEFTRISEKFEKARKGIEALANEARREWRRTKWGRSDSGCYRILSNPEDELKRWEEKDGYRVEDSTWGRFPCTANKYLPWMMRQDIVPPWLRAPEVMFEIEKGLGIYCLRYAQAAVGGFPSKKADGCEPASDMYVSSEDLILSECWSNYDVKIEHIKRVYIGSEAHSEVKEKASAFAERHGIPATYGFPDPEVDAEHEEWLKEHYPPEKAEEEIKYWRESRRKAIKEPLQDLVHYLKERRKRCWDIWKPPRDVAAAALAEAYDRVMHHEAPVGASDAIAEMIELGKREPMLSPAFSVGHPMEGCLKPSSNPGELNECRLAFQAAFELINEKCSA